MKDSQILGGRRSRD